MTQSSAKFVITGPAACGCGERAVYALANVVDTRSRWLCQGCILDEILGDSDSGDIGDALANSVHGHLLGSEHGASKKLRKIQEILSSE